MKIKDDTIFAFVQRKDVEKQNVLNIYDFVLKLINLKEDEIKCKREHLILIFDGYDDDGRELSEIREVKEFCKTILQRLPEIVYFLEVENESLQNILAIANDITLAKVDNCDKIAMQISPDRELMLYIVSSFVQFCVKINEDFNFIVSKCNYILKTCSLKAEEGYLESFIKMVSSKQNV